MTICKRLAALTLSMSMSACSSMPGDEGDPSSQLTQAAVLNPYLAQHPEGLFDSPGDVDVCFLPRLTALVWRPSFNEKGEKEPTKGQLTFWFVSDDAAMDEEDVTSVRGNGVPVTEQDFQRIKGHVEETWGKSSGLNFVFHRMCPADSRGYITIYYRGDFDPTGNGQAAGGKGSRLGKQPRLDYRNDVQIYLGTDNKWNTIHEFGHALGLSHPFEESLFRAAYPNCKSDESAVEDNARLTEIDAQSVMNYHGESCGGSRNDGYLSWSDVLAAEILYPKSSEPLPILCSHSPCFNTAAGVLGFGEGRYSSYFGARGVLLSALSHVLRAPNPFEVAPDETAFEEQSTPIEAVQFAAIVRSTPSRAVGSRWIEGVSESNREKFVAVLNAAY